MDSSVNSAMEDLAARSTVKDYGNMSIVTIPGCSTLSKTQRIEVLQKIRQREIADALLSRLQCITPPLDEEEENEESRSLEAQARKELENDGCPPCYPPHLNIPLQNPPEEYQPIIEYWQSFPGTDDVILCAQLSDWQKFRRSQSRVRHYYLNKPLSQFMDKVRERRRRHNLNSDVRLLLDPRQQSQLENWMEFQNYHLQQLEKFEEEHDELEKELDNNQRKAKDEDIAVSKLAMKDTPAIQQDLRYFERKLNWHKVLLQWIEEQRRAMDEEYQTFVQGDNEEQYVKAIPRTSTRGRRKRSQPPAVLGNVRVSKSVPKKRRMQTRKSKALEFRPAIQDPDAVLHCSVPQTPRRRKVGTKKETALRQFRPQRVSKTERFADANTESLLGTERRGGTGQIQFSGQARSQRRRTRQQPQLAPGNVETRSGRISRPPVRWAPE